MTNSYFVPTDIDPVATGKLIRLQLKEQKLTIAYVANSLCISEQAIYKMLRGENLSSIGNLYNISRLLGVTIDELLIPYRTCEEDRDLSSSFFLFVVIISKLRV